MNMPQFMLIAIEAVFALAICTIIVLSIIALVYAIKIMQRKLYDMKMEDYIHGIENEVNEIRKDIHYKIRQEKDNDSK